MNTTVKCCVLPHHISNIYYQPLIHSQFLWHIAYGCLKPHSVKFQRVLIDMAKEHFHSYEINSINLQQIKDVLYVFNNVDTFIT